MLAPTILPTTDITGTAGWRPGDMEPFFNGTSCSAPYAAGVCALILSANPALTPTEVRNTLVNTCTDVVSVEAPIPGWDVYAGYGLVNAYQAVLAVSPPTANFFASTTNGCQPLMVNFMDISTGQINSWQWNFGDGGMDFVPNPIYVYNQPGTYTVSLTVTGPGGSDTLILPNLITVDPVAVSDFSATVTKGLWPLTTTFLDASQGSPTSWDWDFGDGDPHNNTQSPAHTYLAPGLYTVSLSTGNACGGDVMIKTDYITVCDTMVVDFDASATVGVDTLTVAFTDQSRGAPVAWDWDFGDGGDSQAQNPAHFFAAPGRYTVTLIASNDCEADTLVTEQMIVLATSTGIDETPRAFALEGNTPNPFNPSTVIAFSLEREGRARLEIFDTAGRRLDVLVDGVIPAGRHEVVWTPSRLPSGMYFARLTSGGRTAIQNMALVK